ncbi:Polyphosphoinositide phosphatase, partial [Paragonimus kellicotti]
GSTIGNPPIQYIAFDIARVQKSKRLVALDQLRPIVDACVRLTGMFIISGNRFGEHRTMFGINPLQCGLIRVNCVDCLDRTNTAQFVVGQVALAYQLYYLGFLAEPVIVADSKIDRLLQNMYDEHGDTLALQYGGSQLVHNIDTYKKTHKLSSQSRDFVQTLSRYYSNKFSDWDKQCVTNLFLRTYRPVMWPGTLFALACEHLYYVHYYFLRNSNSLHTKVPTNGHGLEASAMEYLDAILAALAIPVNESLWDATTDNHLHWLQACSRVPVYQTSLTDWCPRVLLNSLPYGLDWVEKSRLLSSRIMLVSSNDARVDWFNERYQPFCYQSLNTMTTIRWVELITHPPLVENLFTQSGSPLAEHTNRVNADDQLTLPRPKRFSVFTRPEVSRTSRRNRSSYDVNVARSVPNLVDLKLAESRGDVERHGSPGKVKLHTTVEEDTASTSTPTFPRKKYSSTNLKRKNDSANKDEAGSLEESSSESDSADSTGSFLQFYPPMSISERNMSVVSGPLNRECASVSHSSYISPVGRKLHNALRESNYLDQQHHAPVSAIWDWMQMSSPYDAEATDAFITSASVSNTYQRYMDIKLDSPRTDFLLLSTSVVQPSITAMHTYRKCVDLAEGKIYPIPSLSMEFYQATVAVASRLQC